MAYEQFKLGLGIPRKLDPDTRIPAWKRILAGSMAGCTAVTATYPFDILRARIVYAAAHAPPGDRLYVDAIRTLWSEGLALSTTGLAGFYQGYIPTILGIIPYAGTSFFTFDALKQLYLRHNPDTAEVPQLARLLFGMFAGICAQTVTYPLDTVRRRSQLWRIAKHLPPSDTSRPWDSLRMIGHLVRTGGLKELFVGLSINYLKVAPSMGISFVVYDYIKEHVLV